MKIILESNHKSVRLMIAFLMKLQVMNCKRRVFSQVRQAPALPCLAVEQLWEREYPGFLAVLMKQNIDL